MKIAKKFKDELKLGNLEKEELIVRLDESNKKNEFWEINFLIGHKLKDPLR